MYGLQHRMKTAEKKRQRKEKPFVFYKDILYDNRPAPRRRETNFFRFISQAESRFDAQQVQPWKSGLSLLEANGGQINEGRPRREKEKLQPCSFYCRRLNIFE